MKLQARWNQGTGSESKENEEPNNEKTREH